jgi:hypothetical protein
VPEEEGEYHDAAEEHKGKLGFYSYICLLCMS